VPADPTRVLVALEALDQAALNKQFSRANKVSHNVLGRLVAGIAPAPRKRLFKAPSEGEDHPWKRSEGTEERAGIRIFGVKTDRPKRPASSHKIWSGIWLGPAHDKRLLEYVHQTRCRLMNH